ncbi:MAG: Uma2 family endonuclease, partial [Pyrinomonadaceae bacterium]
SKLEVPEFWLYDGNQMKIYKLVGGDYSEVKNSPALPILSSQTLTDFLEQLKSSDQYEVLIQFEKWLENQK